MKALHFENCAGWGSVDYRADKLERQRWPKNDA